jgi:hypothetical protein
MMAAPIMQSMMQSIAAAPEPRAAGIARETMQAMGGEAGWKRARYVRFDFMVSTHGQVRIAQSHLWDRQTGRYRLEDKSVKESTGVVLFNVRDRQGTAYLKGKKLEGTEAAAAVKGGYRTYRGDIDWLAMPFLWLTPEYHLKYEGEKSVKGEACDVLDVTVDEPAGAPPVHYKTYVSKKSHLIAYWSVGVEPALWEWRYATVDGIKLANDHINDERQAGVSMGNVKLLDKVDEAFLTDPGHKLEQLK